MNAFSVRVGDELPYRVRIDNLEGAGTTPVGAICAALSVGGKIPPALRGDTHSPVSWHGKDVASYLFWNYEINPSCNELIRALEHNKFPAEGSHDA